MERAEVGPATVKHYVVKQVATKHGKYRKGASTDLALNVNQMGIKIFDGDKPLDTLRYAELESWEFNDDNEGIC